MQYGRFNFYKNTFCIFRQVDKELLSDLVPNHVSRSGSRYYFTDKGVYRFSTHWGRAAKCKWRLTAANGSSYERKGSVGYADWGDFRNDDAHSRIYWIKLNYERTLVQYFHVDDPEFDGSKLRTSEETTRLIRKIRTIISRKNYSEFEILQALSS